MKELLEARLEELEAKESSWYELFWDAKELFSTIRGKYKDCRDEMYALELLLHYQSDQFFKAPPVPPQETINYWAKYAKE